MDQQRSQVGVPALVDAKQFDSPAWVRLGLSAFDLDVLLVCLAPEIDRRYERLYTYLQDDVTRKHPSVALVLDLLCLPLETKIALRQRLAPAAPLRHHGLLHILDDPNLRQASL